MNLYFKTIQKLLIDANQLFVILFGRVNQNFRKVKIIVDVIQEEHQTFDIK